LNKLVASSTEAEKEEEAQKPVLDQEQLLLQELSGTGPSKAASNA
jgi:hypothetical protein